MVALSLVLGLVQIQYSVTVSDASGIDDGCPSPRQVAHALDERIPGITTAAGTSASDQALRLALIKRASASTALEITDARGETRLRRDLGGGGPACADLAETVALIVERYLHEIGYRGPAAPELPVLEQSQAEIARPARSTEPARTSPTYRADVRFGAGLVAARETGAEGELVVSASLWLGRIALVASGGLPQPRNQDVYDGRFSLWRVPLGAAVRLRMPIGPGWLEPEAGAGLELTWARTQGISDSQRVFRADPSLDLAAGYVLPFSTWGLVALRAAGAAALRQHNFVVAGMSAPLYQTPSVSGQILMMVGVRFGMKKSGGGVP